MVMEVKSFSEFIFLKLVTPMILSEHRQPQIDGTSSDAQSAVILRNKDNAVAQLDSAAGKLNDVRTTYQYWVAICITQPRR